jgi:ABC-type branched-subunit amino acid transport system substrate-binding protein
MHRLSRLVAAAAVTVIAAAACSSGGGNDAAHPTITEVPAVAGPAVGWSDGGFTAVAKEAQYQQCSDGKPSSQTRGVTPTSIRIGGLVTMTSPDGATLADSVVGAKARIERANAEGGVNGRTLDYAGTQDDGQNPATNGSAAEVLVQRQNVFAVVPTMVSLNNYFDTLCASKTPFFGWGINTSFCRNVIAFGITGCAVDDPQKAVRSVSTANGVALTKIGVGKGSTVALIGVDSAAAVAANEWFRRCLEAVGIKVVYNKHPVPLAGLTDSTALVNAVMTSDGGQPPDAIIPLVQAAGTLKLAEAFKSAGYQGKLVLASLYDPRLTQVSTLQDTYASLQWEQPTETDAPAIAAMKADIDKYAPGQVLSIPAMAGWFTADMFISALRKTGRDLTVDSFLKTLNGGDFTYYDQGALAETRWPLNHVVPSPCFALARLTGKKYEAAAKLSCGQIVKIN